MNAITTVKIKLLTSLAGREVVHKPGDVIEVGVAEAQRHFRDNNAVPYQTSEEEQATNEQREKAMRVERRTGAAGGGTTQRGR